MNQSTLPVEEIVEAIAPEVWHLVIKSQFDHFWTLIDEDELRAQGLRFLNSDEYRRQISVQQARLMIDLYAIINKIWGDILEQERDRLNEVLNLRKVEIAAEVEKARALREVELAKVELAKARECQSWDVLIYRLKTLRIPLIAGVLIFAIGVLAGQSFQAARYAAQSVVKHPPAKTLKKPVR